MRHKLRIARYATGARIFITGRDIAKGEQVAKSLSAPGQVPVEFIPMELDSFDSIKACAVEFSKRSEGLNILICNAGVMVRLKTCSSLSAIGISDLGVC